MRPKGKNDYCPQCEEFNEVLDGICCRCGWHLTAGRQSMEEEQLPVLEKMDKAVEDLQRALGMVE